MATTEPNNRTKEIEEGKGMAILAYIIALIPYFAGDKNNKFVRFHAIQGMNILIIAVAYGVVSGIINSIVYSATIGSCYRSIYSGAYGAGCAGGWGVAGIVSTVLGLIGLAIGIINLIGLVYAVQGQEKEVPLLGKVKFIKK